MQMFKNRKTFLAEVSRWEIGLQKKKSKKNKTSLAMKMEKRISQGM